MLIAVFVCVQSLRAREYSYAVYVHEARPAQRLQLLQFHSPREQMLRKYGHIVELNSECPDHSLDLAHGLRSDEQWTRLCAYLTKVSTSPVTRYPAQMQYLADLILDESIVHRKPSACTWDELNSGCIYAPWMVEDSHYSVSHCLFWYETRTMHPEIVHGFNKALPQPCQTRRLKGVLEDIMAGSLQHRRFLREWVVSSIMGQYAHVPRDAKPGLRQRDDMQFLARRAGIVLDEFIAHCPWTTMFALRERMCYSLVNDPPFAKNLSYMFDLEKFTARVHATMDQIRREIRSHYPLVVRHEATQSLTFLNPVVWTTLESICKRAHAGILPLCYQRQRAPFYMALHTMMRGKSGSFEMRVLNPVSPENPDPHAQLSADDLKQLHVRPWVSHEVAAAIHRLVQSQDPMTPSIAQTMFQHLHRLGVPLTATQWIECVAVESDLFRVGKRLGRSELTEFKKYYPYALYVMQLVCLEWHRHSNTLTYELPHHYRVNQLRAVAERLQVPPFTEIPYDRCFFDYCEVCGRIYSLHNGIPRHQDLGISGWPRQTPRTRKRAGHKGGDPEETKMRADATPVAPSPLEAQAQEGNTSATASGRHPLLHEYCAPSPGLYPPPQVMRKWVQHMHHRAQVMGVTSVLQDFWKHPGEACRDTPGFKLPAATLRKIDAVKEKHEADNKDKRRRPKPTHHNATTYGFNDVVYDPFTDEMHCGNNHRNGHLQCSEQRLLRVMLLGRVLLLQGRVWMLCPQKACGLAMMYDPRFCASNERGVACSQCTAAMTHAHYKRLSVLPPLSEQRLKCELCTNLSYLHEKSKCFVYPFNVLVCSTHHSTHLQQWIAMQQYNSRKDVVDLISQFYERQRRNRTQMFARSNRTDLQRRRQTSRMRPAYRFQVG